jgi:hypothetical protein
MYESTNLQTPEVLQVPRPSTQPQVKSHGASLPPFWHKGRFIIIPVLLLAYVLMGIAIERGVLTVDTQIDFNVYWAASRLFIQNQDIYDGSLTSGLIRALDLEYVDDSDYIYPPYLAAVLSPLTHLHPLRAGLLWYLGGLVAIGFAVWLILRGRAESRGEVVELLQWGDYLFVALASAPAIYSFYVGQINAFILLLLAAVYFLLEKDKQVLAGIILAVSILLKVAPVLLVFYMVARKKYIALLCTAVVVTGIVLLTWPVFGFHLRTYFTTVLPEMSVPEPKPINQSLHAFFGRIFTRNDYTAAILDAPRLSRFLTLLFSTVLILLTAAKLVPDNPTLAESCHDMTFGALVTLMTIVPPLAWETLHILLAFPLIVLFGRWARMSRGQRFLLAVSIFLLNVQTLGLLFHASPGKFPALRYLWPLMSLGLYGATILLFLQIRIRETVGG